MSASSLRRFARQSNATWAKTAYRSLILPAYRMAGIPVYDITARNDVYTWFRIPKNATHSIRTILERTLPPDAESSYVPYFRRQHEHAFRFCFIRNPWDRLVSVFCNKVQMKLMFEQCWDKDFRYFVNYVSSQRLDRCDAHIRLQTSLFPASDVDFVGRMENFPTDMNYVMEKLSIQTKQPHFGRTQRDDYHGFYDDQLREQVAKLYQKDIEFGSYRF